MINRALIEQISNRVVGGPGHDVFGVSTDSRGNLKGQLFIPLIGERFDGHDFLEMAIKNGATSCLWQDDHPLPDVDCRICTFYIVTDTLTALQDLAKLYLQTLDAMVIGITGSNGKTSTKDLVGAVVKQKGPTHITKGNYNNHIGLPLTILSAQPDTAFLVLEMGMSNFHEIECLSKIAEPDIAIITNIGESHIEFLKTREGIRDAKLEILEGLKVGGWFIYDGDEPLLVNDYPYEVATVSLKKSGTVNVEVVEMDLAATTFKEHAHPQLFKVPFVGKHHAKNAMYAVIVGRLLGLTDRAIANAFTSIEKTGMRFEQETYREHLLINDAYNASPTSMIGAISILKDLSDTRKKVLVLGDMFELGDASVAYHREVGVAIASPIDYLITVGKDARYISEAASVTATHVETITEAAQLLKSWQEPSVILFKASRGMRFEEIIIQIKQ